MNNSFKTAIVFLFLTLLNFSAKANDGMYLTSGGVIYPTKATKISIDKEILSFTVRDKVCQVDIYFEFNNLEAVERKVLVGFQAPTSAGDVSEEVSNKCQIADFKIINGGKILPYQLKAADCEGCELKDPKEFSFNQGVTGVFVFLFEMTFKPGINKVNHSYNFPASSSIDVDQSYEYILKTGAKWAGGAIKDLTVQMDMGPNKYFYVEDIFGAKANWSVIGTGKVTNKQFTYRNEDSCRMVRVLSGKLEIKIKDLKPIKNIGFGILNPDSFISAPTDYNRGGKIIGLGRMDFDGELTKEDLKLMRNTVYAQHGYAFKTKELQDYFGQFEWYIPDPNLTLEQIVLTQKEKEFIEKILKKEQ